jgi:hypothetical protein
MKRVKLICMLIVLLLVYCGRLSAKPVSAEKAQQAVTGWLKADARPLGAALGRQLRKTDSFSDEQGQVIYYVVYLQPRGFVIVPADDTVEPILAFAESGIYDPSFDNPLGALVNQDVQSRIAASEDILTIQGANTEALQKITSKWEHLAAESEQSEEVGILAAGLPSVSDPRVDPLLRTKWDQTTCCDPCACYNYYTPLSDPWDPCDLLLDSLPGSPNPYGDPNNYPCGCVATAMAQLMRYHQHPNDPCGIGKLQFQIWVNGNPQPAWTRGGDGNGGPYDFNSMVYEPNCNTTQAQRQAIGALCYDAGVSVNMSYGPGASAASLTSAKTALKNPFMYSNAFYKQSLILPIADLIQMINPNLDYEHPVLLGLVPEHAVVVDGYGYDSGTMYHHINMGWAGVQDAWYNFYTDMPPSFAQADTCVYNIFVTGAGEIISGRVTDPSGNILADVAVTAFSTSGGAYRATTNNRGIYVLPHVPSATTYAISVSWLGYSFGGKVVTTSTSVDNGTIGNVWTDIALKPLRYVDINAPGNNDGSSWYNAYNYLQDALADPCASVILVAQGTYHPDSNSGTPNGSGDRYARFVLKSGMALCGGYAGYGASDPNARDVKLYKTILSGDLADNDADVDDPCDLLNEPTRAENSYHVLDTNGTDASTILDGFTITAGNANADISEYLETFGGGMLNFPTSCSVKNCVFIENSALLGGAMYNCDCNIYISNCSFVKNSAEEGGGIANRYSVSQITNCTFSGNNAAQYGGGINNANCSPTITNCVFSGNTASEGGGIYNFTSSCSPIITNCAFSGNQAVVDGGGIRNCVLSSPTITNCILWGNIDPNGLQISDEIGSVATVNYSDVQGGWSGAGGVGNINTDPYFVDVNGSDSIIGTIDDNLRLSPGSPCIDDGNDTAVPADSVDLDGDGNTTEQTPLDLDLRSRFADGDCNSTVVVDMGAYEFSWPFIGDFDGSCSIDFIDYAFLASAWLENNPSVDITPPPSGDSIVDIYDLAVLCDNWLAGK